VIVDATSGNSGNKSRDSKMHREVLESARYPEIVFSPKHVSGFVGGQDSFTVQVSGDFTIHGGTHEMTMSVPVSVKASTVEGHTTFVVPYDAWGMKNPSTFLLKVDKTVRISVTAVGVIESAAAAQAAH
jgi:polyisoprenoid-binding protein YceI